MKLNPLPHLARCAACAALCTMLPAQTPAPAAPPALLLSDVFAWEKMTVTPNAKGTRRAVYDGPTATVDKMHCHITTLNHGEKSGEPSKHLQEEVIIVKEGLVEAHWDGQSKTGGPGSVNGTGALRSYSHELPIVIDRWGLDKEDHWYPFTDKTLRNLEYTLKYVFGTKLRRFFS